MNKTLLASLLGISCIFSGAAQAEMSFSLGYIHTEMDNTDAARDYFGQGVDLSTNLNGVNFKFGFKPADMRLGVITSLSYSGKTTEYKYRNPNTGRRYTEKFEQSYGSILVGPSYEVASWFTPYALVGIAFNTNEYRYDSRWSYYDDDDDTKTAFAFGGGFQIHPFNLGSGQVLIDLSYERALFKDNTTDSFVIGGGYRF